jgi:hypothetical protein
MKLIFSRKGFDTASGGCPSPIFLDGTLLSLPIPDKDSPIYYKDISFGLINYGEIVSELTKGRVRNDYRAHLDPDIRFENIERKTGWKPLFGQLGAAQCHLKNQNIQNGDIFLFFGLFQRTLYENSVLCFDSKSKPIHIIWGWLQIGSIISIDASKNDSFLWAKYHPHFHMNSDNSNTAYISKNQLEIHHSNKTFPGSGVFLKYSKTLQLTSDGKSSSCWDLNSCFYPENIENALSYHRSISKWKKKDHSVELKTVGRGQEFVLDCLYYKGVENWFIDLLEKNKKNISPILKERERG